jgi:hypothetical protein
MKSKYQNKKKIQISLLLKGFIYNSYDMEVGLLGHTAVHWVNDFTTTVDKFVPDTRLVGVSCSCYLQLNVTLHTDCKIMKCHRPILIYSRTRL